MLCPTAQKLTSIHTARADNRAEFYKLLTHSARCLSLPFVTLYRRFAQNLRMLILFKIKRCKKKKRRGCGLGLIITGQVKCLFYQGNMIFFFLFHILTTACLDSTIANLTSVVQALGRSDQTQTEMSSRRSCPAPTKHKYRRKDSQDFSKIR